MLTGFWVREREACLLKAEGKENFSGQSVGDEM